MGIKGSEGCAGLLSAKGVEGTGRPALTCSVASLRVLTMADCNSAAALCASISLERRSMSASLRAAAASSSRIWQRACKTRIDLSVTGDSALNNFFFFQLHFCELFSAKGRRNALRPAMA